VERQQSSARFHQQEWRRQRIAILTEPGGAARFAARDLNFGGEGDKDMPQQDDVI
jgi:hypothetical protein